MDAFRRLSSTESLASTLTVAFGSLESAGVTSLGCNRLNVVSPEAADALRSRLGDALEGVTIISPARRRA
jgi:hypothetical protein